MNEKMKMRDLTTRSYQLLVDISTQLDILDVDETDKTNYLEICRSSNELFKVVNALNSQALIKLHTISVPSTIPTNNAPAN